MALLEIITENIVKVPLKSKTKTEVIRELIQILKDANKITDIEAVYDLIMKRESLGSTGLEMGVAVPHTKCPQVKSLTLAIGISPNGVDFEAIDMSKSHIFFLMLAPPDKSGPHIEALSEIANLAKSNAFLRLLINAKTPAQVIDLIKAD